MKVIRRFSKAWVLFGLPFWIKPYACILNERGDRIRWLAIEIDGSGVSIDLWRFSCGVMYCRILKP